jgi:hypothetical protein
MTSYPWISGSLDPGPLSGEGATGFLLVTLVTLVFVGRVVQTHLNACVKARR